MMQYEIEIQALSPIHIGTGDQISPFEFVIKNNIFYRIDLASFLAEMPSGLRADFDRAVDNSNIIYMRKFIAKNIDLKRYSLFNCDISDKLADDYEKKFKDTNNQFLVNMFVRSGFDSKPVIPGSSIKGAIRTAIVNAENNVVAPKGNEPPQFPKNGDNRWESVPLKYGNKKDGKYCSNIRTDPFRTISVSDIYLQNSITLIDNAQMINKDCIIKSKGIVQYYEQTYSLLDGENITGKGTFSINTDLQEKNDMIKITAESIAKTCYKFYSSRMEEEHRKFYIKNDELKQYSNQLLEQKYNDFEFPIRLGRFSHCESVTVDQPYRNIKTRRVRGRPLPWGTTRTLANGKFPFGWAKVTLKKAR